MIVVSDTSPITNLYKIDQLVLLKKLYSQVVIPVAVYKELCFLPLQKEYIDNASWIIVQQLKDSRAVIQFKNRLDPGESEAILLAEELNATILLIDEQYGRSVARNRNIEIVGLIGVLINAKQKGYIHNLKEVLDDLITRSGFLFLPCCINMPWNLRRSYN